MDSARFTLDPPNASLDPTARASRTSTGSGLMVQGAAGAAGVVPLLPRLTYKFEPGTYKQWWMVKTVGINAANMAK